MSWYEEFLSERDKLVFQRSGHGNRVGFGERPVVLVIDVNYDFCGERREPILESIRTWHNSCGEEAWDAIEAIQELLAAARPRRIPIIYTTGYGAPIAGSFGLGRWIDKVPADELSIDPRANEIVDAIAPLEHDIVIRKTMPSCFFGTNLMSYLVNLGADTLIVCGTTTSGCVRATVVEAFSNSFRVNVVEEATFDRAQVSHAINLFDMDMKYADVTPLADVIAYLQARPIGLFGNAMPILADLCNK